MERQRGLSWRPVNPLKQSWAAMDDLSAVFFLNARCLPVYYRGQGGVRELLSRGSQEHTFPSLWKFVHFSA